MDLRKLKKLIDLVEESGIAEIEVTEGEEKVRITRSVAARPCGARFVQRAKIAHGGHILSRCQPFYACVCGSGANGESGRHAVHH